MKDEYIKGYGLTITLSPQEINNLYRPGAQFKIESFDYVLVENFPKTKFAPVLLKEWYFMIKPGGYLVINYVPARGLSFESMEKLCWWIFRINYNYNIEEHVEKKDGSKIIIRKKHSLFTKGDSIDKWTFGIVTNGQRDDWLKLIIKSIRDQKIPSYEIIVCGKYRDRKEKDIIYIDFNERPESGWIQKKKNLIAERAAYENLCIIHDRMVFDKGWYKGMQKYGNAFEILSCVQIERGTGVQAGDWLTKGGPASVDYRIARMKYTDWDYYTFLSMQLIITKKSIWQKILWNETKNWKNGDDIDTSFRARDMGYIIRFNPYASVIALSWDHGKIPLRYNRADGFLPKDMIIRRTVRFIASHLYKFPYMKKMFDKLYTYFMKTPLHKKFIFDSV